MIAERAGYTVVLGAFLAGSLVAESELGSEVEKLIAPVRYLFGEIFFVGVGMLIDPHLLAMYWRALVVLTAVAIVGKVVSVSLASVAVGERPNTAVKSGFAMAQIGTFSILFALAAGEGTTGSLLYSLAVALKAITSVVCPLMVRASNPAADWVDRHLPMPVQNALSRYGAWLERVRTTPESDGIERGEAG